MSIKLTKKIKGARVIEGFPGFGLVGTIATGFLVDHLKCEQIGKFYFEELPATIAIHEEEIVDPVGIFYNKEYNLVIIHAISSAAGIEWKAADAVLDVCRQVDAKELICIEGVGSQIGEGERTFYYSVNQPDKKQLKKAGVGLLSEGIIVGVTSALLLKAELPLTCVFAETHSALPDSKAAAKAIEMLDKYLNLKVDYKPLLKQAEEFEGKLKKLMEDGAKAQDLKEKKTLSYVG